MRNYLTFAGHDSTEFNIWISGSGTFDSPSRDVSQIVIPGRNGVLLQDNGRYNPLPISYPAFISNDFVKSFEAFRAFLCSQIGYKRLEDTYHPEEFRLAYFSDSLSPSVKTLNRSGEFTLKFTCKSERYLKSGEKTISFEDDAQIFNPTLYPSKPLIRVYGTGRVGIGSYIITVTAVDDYVDIDCDSENAFKGSENCNSDIELTSGSFIRIDPGNNGVLLDGNISKIEIIPRWWTI